MDRGQRGQPGMQTCRHAAGWHQLARPLAGPDGLHGQHGLEASSQTECADDPTQPNPTHHVEWAQMADGPAWSKYPSGSDGPATTTRLGCLCQCQSASNASMPASRTRRLPFLPSLLPPRQPPSLASINLQPRPSHHLSSALSISHLHSPLAPPRPHPHPSTATMAGTCILPSGQLVAASARATPLRRNRGMPSSHSPGWRLFTRFSVAIQTTQQQTIC